MASITTEGNRRTIQFVAADGKRKSIRLGEVAMRDALAVRVKVEALAAAKLTSHAPTRDVSQWVTDLDAKLYDRLAAVGLVEVRLRATLGGFLDQYIASRADVKPSTVVVLQRVRRYLATFFGEDRSLRTITPGDADAWRLHLVGNAGLAENTVRRSCGVAKQFFKSAVRSKLIDANPFIDLSSVVKGNPAKFAFITRAAAQRVLDACPDVEWRLLFALARYGGLRVPSEPLRLRWRDIDWDRQRMTVHSPKTEHHEGGASRVVPIFPELMPYLREAFEQAADGAEFCITRYRSDSANLRTQLYRIIERAGLKPWPKLWVNLRSSRETELANEHPLHVVTAWIGNTEKVAAKHYLQVTDDHFTKAVQNPVQQTHAERCTEAQGVPACDSQVVDHSILSDPVLLAASGCKDMGMGPACPERLAESSEKQGISESSPNEAVQNPVQSAGDADLGEVVAAWRRLTLDERATVLAVVRATSGNSIQPVTSPPPPSPEGSAAGAIAPRGRRVRGAFERVGAGVTAPSEATAGTRTPRASGGTDGQTTRATRTVGKKGAKRVQGE